jgi:polyribonucleotide nucleotidyltransferase
MDITDLIRTKLRRLARQAGRLWPTRRELNRVEEERDRWQDLADAQARLHGEEALCSEQERNEWRQRAAMLERLYDECVGPGRRGRVGRRRRRVLAGFVAGRVRSGRISRITSDGAFVRLGGHDWPVHIPELSWGDIEQPSEVLAIGQVVRVRTSSAPAHAQHPFLVLI